jgi:hypothetical protein
MTTSQTIIVSMVLSLPLVGIIAIGRALLCVFRCHEAKKIAFVVLSCVSILVMVIVLAFDVVVLFGYGVAHTGKDASTDLIVLGITIIPTYLGAGGIWLLCRYMERRLTHSDA